MNKTELVKAFQNFYETKTGEHISLTTVNKNMDLVKEFLEGLVDSGTTVSVPGFFSLKYKTREAGVTKVAGKEYNLPAKTTPIVKLASNFSKLG